MVSPNSSVISETEKRDRRMLAINDLADKQIAAIIFNHASRTENANGNSQKAEELLTIAQQYQSEVADANAKIDAALGKDKGDELIDPRRHHGYAACVYSHVSDDMLFSYEISGLKGKMELNREDNKPEYADYIGARFHIQHDYMDAYERVKEKGETPNAASISQYVKDIDREKLGTAANAELDISSGLQELIDRIPSRRDQIDRWLRERPPEPKLGGDDSFTPSDSSVMEQQSYAPSPEFATPVQKPNRVKDFIDTPTGEPPVKRVRPLSPLKTAQPDAVEETSAPAEDTPARKGFFSRMKERLSRWKTKSKHAAGKIMFQNYQTPEEKAAAETAREEAMREQGENAERLGAMFKTQKDAQQADEQQRANALPGTFTTNPLAPMPVETIEHHMAALEGRPVQQANAQPQELPDPFSVIAPTEMDYHQAQLKAAGSGKNTKPLQSSKFYPPEAKGEDTAALRESISLKPETWGKREDVRSETNDRGAAFNGPK